MGTMYKEIVARRRLPVLLMLAVILVLMIYVSEIVRLLLTGTNYIGRISTNFFVILMGGIAVYQYIKCKIRYRYSIIADEFIIHRISGHTEKVVEHIKLSDIQYIGKVNELRESYITKGPRKYTCSLFNKNLCCCIYWNVYSFKKFYFEPSIHLIDKVIMLKHKKVS